MRIGFIDLPQTFMLRWKIKSWSWLVAAIFFLANRESRPFFDDNFKLNCPNCSTYIIIKVISSTRSFTYKLILSTIRAYYITASDNDHKSSIWCLLTFFWYSAKLKVGWFEHYFSVKSYQFQTFIDNLTFIDVNSCT